MSTSVLRSVVSSAAAAIVVLGAIAPREPVMAQTPAPRPMTFLDMQQMRNAGAPTPSADGRWMLYTLSTPDWQTAERQTDIYLVSMTEGLPSTKQMTFTTGKNETSPAWAPDGRAFFFLSNREAPATAATQNQLYLMRPDGGEARRVTDAKDGVVDYAAQPRRRDARFPRRTERRPAAVARRRRERDGAGDREGRAADEAAGGRRHLGLGARQPRASISRRSTSSTRTRRRGATSASPSTSATPKRPPRDSGRSTSASAKDAKDLKVVKLTDPAAYSVSSFTVSDDGKWVGIRGGSTKRYERNITQEGLIPISICSRPRPGASSG